MENRKHFVIVCVLAICILQLKDYSEVKNNFINSGVVNDNYHNEKAIVDGIIFGGQSQPTLEVQDQLSLPIYLINDMNKFDKKYIICEEVANKFRMLVRILPKSNYKISKCEEADVQYGAEIKAINTRLDLENGKYMIIKSKPTPGDENNTFEVRLVNGTIHVMNAR
jgi:hypothetical protein